MQFDKSFCLGTANIAIAVALAAVPGNGHAQNTALSSAAAASGGASDTDIVVTARKKNEKLQDVPVSVSVVGAADLTRSHARDIKDILGDIPGVASQGSDFGQTRYNVRGISTNSPSPTVGIYLDDVSIVNNTSYFAGAPDLALFDVARVEVLKGPQGTLYGGGSMGGAIKYVSERPNLDRAGGDVKLSASTTAHGAASYDGQAVLNLPVVRDVLAFRAGILYRHDGGYIDNNPSATFANFLVSQNSSAQPFSPQLLPSDSTRDKDDQNSSHVLAVRASALWKPADGLEIMPSFLYQDYHQANPSIFWANNPGLQSGFRIAQPTTDRFYNANLNVVKHFDGFDITSLTGYVHRTVDQLRDYSFYVGTVVPALYASISSSQNDTKSHSISQELRVNSTDTTSRLTWTLGLYYSDATNGFNQDATTVGAAIVFGTPDDTIATLRNRLETKQYAAFGTVAYKIAEPLEFSVGLRGFHIEQSYYSRGDGPLNGGPSSSAGHSKESGVNPKFELSYKASHENLLYASAAKGFRPGGINDVVPTTLCGSELAALGLTAAPNSFKSDSLWTYEVGSKNTLFNRALTLNGSAYYSDWSKIQQKILLNQCGYYYTANVGSARVKGFELNGEFRIARPVTIGGALNFADTEISKTSTGVSAQAGQSVLDTPRWTGNAFVDFHQPLGNGTISARADFQFRSKQRFDFNGQLTASASDGNSVTLRNPSEFIGSYRVVNLSLTYATEKFTYGIFVNNVADTRPIIDYNPTNTTTQVLTLRPRVIGFNVGAHF